MKVGVYIKSEHAHDDHIYGMTIVEKDFVSCYDVRETAVSLIGKIFGEEVLDSIGIADNKLTVTLGGAAPYEATFIYKPVDEGGLL